jgi:hypothetical protein
MGYYEKVKLGLEGKIYVKKIEIKNQKIEIKKDLKIVERKQIKNPTPSEVINNPKIYGKDTFINLLKFLTEKLETLNKLNNGIEDLPQINLCKRNIKHVQDILVRNLYQAKTKKNKKKIEWLDIKINKSKKEKIKKNNKKNTQEIKNKKINKTANKKVERLSFLADVLGVEKKFNKKTTIGDIIKLGMVKPLKNK